jgi:hypothetical protein
VANENPFAAQWAKEARAADFNRTLEEVPMVRDADLEARLGGFIADGTTREVFADRQHETRIIKRALEGRVFGNWVEYFVWTGARDTRWANVIAQCFEISLSGRYLSMERVQPLERARYGDVPFIPWWLQDLQPDNFGVDADGNIKVCDYAMGSLGFDMDEALHHKPGFAIRVPRAE